MSSMSPSTPKFLTSGQIGKLEEIFGDGLRRANLRSKPAQQVIEKQADALVSELVGIVRRRVEAVSSITIILRVKVDPTRSSEQVINATGCNKYIYGEVVKSMPRGTGEETDIHFFRVGRFISDDDLENEYKLRGLRPVDPESLAKVNEDDPSFADSHPNGTHWRDADGKWCFIKFVRGADGKRDVVVHLSNDYVWNADWYFAGVCK